MMKLIVSDVDGTLLPEGTSDLNPELYDVIRTLKEKGILFVAASGRQYHSMLEVLAPVKDEILFAADNGACIKKQDEIVECHALNKELLKEIKEYLDGLEGIYVLASTTEGGYTECQEQWFIDKIKNGYGIALEPVNSLLDIEAPVTKVAVFCEGVDAAVLAAPAVQRFAGRASVMAAGAHWIDFMGENVDKGHAVAALQKKLGILPEETMAFGDNHNDISMLNCAKESYAVLNARAEVKEIAAHVLTEELSVAVLNVLKTLL